MTPTPHTSRLARLADLTYRRRGRVVLAWVVLLVATLAIVPRFAGDFSTEFGTPASESQEARDLIEAHFPQSSGESVNVVWEARDARAAQPRIDRFVEQARSVEGVGDVSAPRYSADGTIGLLRLELDRPSFQLESASGTKLIDLAEETSGEGLRIELGGNLISSAEEGAPPELIGLLAAAVVLLIAFGSIVAVGLPLLVAIFGLGISATLIGIVALAIDTPDFAPAIAGLIGIGVGIDYALLVLTRFRTALIGGADVREAVVEAVTTAGRSVIVAGGTVVVSILGLAFTGVSFLYGVALSASLAVAVVVAASVTLLPATLAFAGRRVDRLHIPGLGRSLKTGDTTLATRWSRVIQRHAVIAAVAGSVVLLALAAPVLGIRWGFPDEGNSPDREHDARGVRARDPRLRPRRKRAAGSRGRVAERSLGRVDPAHRGHARGCVHHAAARQFGRRAGDGDGDPGDGAAVSGDHRSRPHPARRSAGERPRGRPHGDRDRPERLPLRPDPGLHRRRARALVPDPARGVPRAADRAQGWAS